MTQPAMANTDASAAGDIGVGISDPCYGTRFESHTQVPRRIASIIMGICEFKLLASILGHCYSIEMFHFGVNLFFAASTAVESSVVRGPNRTRTGHVIRSVFWALSTQNGLPGWI